MENYNNLSKEELIALLLKKEKEINDIDREKEEIRKEIAEQKKEIRRQNSRIQKQSKEIDRLYAEKRELSKRLEELIAKYEAKKEELHSRTIDTYIPKSEQLDDVFIDEIEESEKKAKKKRRSPTENFLDDLKKAYTGEPIILDFDFDGNGIDKDSVKLFDIDETWKIEYQPSSFKLVKYEKPKYRDKDHVYMNSFNDDPFPHSPLTPSLASNILTMKYSLSVPFYRYSGYLNSIGFNVSDMTISHWAKMSADVLEPLYEKLLYRVLHPETNVIHIDETPIRVLESEKSRSYAFVYATSYYEDPVYIYDFVDGRSTERTKEFLKDYKGCVICDGYGGYDSLSNMGIKIQRCMVHARRYFIDCFKTLDEESQKSHKAYKAVTLMAELFLKEKQFKERKYPAWRIKEERNSKNYQKIISNLDRYIDSLDPGSDEKLDKAIHYYKNSRKELFTYLDDGYVDLDNNLAERVVKPFVIMRKNILFCKSFDGAKTTAKLFSIIQTARANGLKTELYLEYVLSNINKVSIDDLLPWSNKLPDHLKITKKDLL